MLRPEYTQCPIRVAFVLVIIWEVGVVQVGFIGRRGGTVYALVSKSSEPHNPLYWLTPDLFPQPPAFVLGVFTLKSKSNRAILTSTVASVSMSRLTRTGLVNEDS